MYISFKTFSYIVRHLDSTASYLPTGLHLGFFRSWPSLFLPSSFSSVFLVLSFVSASTSMLFWAVFLLPFFEHGHTMTFGCIIYEYILSLHYCKQNGYLLSHLQTALGYEPQPQNQMNKQVIFQPGGWAGYCNVSSLK